MKSTFEFTGNVETTQSLVYPDRVVEIQFTPVAELNRSAARLLVGDPVFINFLRSQGCKTVRVTFTGDISVVPR